MYSILAGLEAGAILDFSKARVFVGKQFGTSIVSHSMKYRVFDELWITSTMNFCSVRTFSQDIRLWGVNLFLYDIPSNVDR